LFYIYRLKNTVNNKSYIGVTNNFKKRIREHSYASNNYKISRAIRKYGWENFEYTQIDHSISHEYAYKTLEKMYIIFYDTFYNGYNSTLGGEGSVGHTFSEKTREKMRLKKLGRKLSSKHKEKISIANKGRLFSQETREKISKKLKNNKNFLGKTFSEETKKVLSEKKALNYVLISPKGNIIEVHNMRKFCLENNLSASAMSRVISGKAKHHKGWKNHS
jgi:group I intron endonuclease